MYIKLFVLVVFISTVIGANLLFWKATAYGADSNTTVSSTVVTDKLPPTASAPSININNSDVCKSGITAGLQTQIFGLATGTSIEDKNCERIKLSRSLYFMGMKVAAVSLLCQDPRVFDAMWMAGTPCPYKGSIGEEAKESWKTNLDEIPSGSEIQDSLQDEATKLRRAAIAKSFPEQSGGMYSSPYHHSSEPSESQEELDALDVGEDE